MVRLLFLNFELVFEGARENGPEVAAPFLIQYFTGVSEFAHPACLSYLSEPQLSVKKAFKVECALELAI